MTILESVQFSAEASRSQALSAQEVLNINTRVMNTNKVCFPIHPIVKLWLPCRWHVSPGYFISGSRSSFNESNIITSFTGQQLVGFQGYFSSFVTAW